MRIAIACRIFAPEPSAAAFRLGALTAALRRDGHQVTVLTVRLPKGQETGDNARQYRVSRFPVLRDRNGYVRGYLQYLSFDVPLFLRLLFANRFDLIVSEPPPTTGFFVRLVAAIRNTPYAYYAADIWSDASSQTGAPGWVVRAVRGIESFALQGAISVLSVSNGVTERLAAFGVTDAVDTIGNGVDVSAFRVGEISEPMGNLPHSRPMDFVYAGTASEWHGAGIFVEALPRVLSKYPSAKLLFIGGGSERETIEGRAAELGISNAIQFESVRTPEELAPALSYACAAIASVRPGAGYDFAFPTKLYSAAVCGAPLIYAGPGPAIDFVRTEVSGEPLGWATGSETNEVAEAMLLAAAAPFDARRRQEIANWAAQHVSLTAVAERAAQYLAQRVSGGK